MSTHIKVQVSVIIPTLNEEAYIGSLLTDLHNQTRTPEEIIIVDGQSRDKTIEVAHQFKDVKIFTVYPPSVATQRTQGAKHAKCDILVFLDADVHLPKKFLENLLTEFKKKKLDFACPLYIPHHSTPGVNIIFGLYNAVLIAFQKLIPSGAGMCIIVKRDVFLKHKGFDARYKFEDVEWIRRMAKMYRFGMIYKKLYVSDRRFKKYGTLRMFSKYILLTVLVAASLLKLSNYIKYPFGEYNKDKR